MNKKGIAWSRANADMIVDNMIDVGRAHRIPGARAAAHKFLDLAIERAEKDLQRG